MIEQVGEMEFEFSDDANIPIDIWLTEDEDDNCNKTGRWVLRAGNYMPRKGVVWESAYEVKSDNRDELVAIVQKYIIPLYNAALESLQGICNGTNDSLYYWDRPKKETT